MKGEDGQPGERGMEGEPGAYTPPEDVRRIMDMVNAMAPALRRRDRLFRGARLREMLKEARCPNLMCNNDGLMPQFDEDQRTFTIVPCPWCAERKELLCS